MKKNHIFIYVSILIGLVSAFNFGCKKNAVPPVGQSPTLSEQSATNEASPATGGQTAATIVSADKTSFAEVTSQLDSGGNFYLYLGTAQWLEHLSSKVESLRQRFASM